MNNCKTPIICTVVLVFSLMFTVNLFYGQAIKFIRNPNLSALKSNSIYLQLGDSTRSKIGVHKRFNLMFDGIRIYGAEVKLNIHLQGDTLSSFASVPSNLMLPAEKDKKDFSDFYSRANVLDIYSIDKEELVLFPSEKGLIYAILIQYSDPRNDVYQEIIHEPTQGDLLIRDLRTFFSAGDTSISGGVFLPDPLTTAQVEYGGIYTDENDSDLLVLNDQIFQIQTQGWYNTDSGRFYLENDYVRITEYSDPVTAITSSLDGSFNFTRNEDGFEDINAFYHLTNYHDYLGSLGFGSLVSYQLDVDAHALNGQDNSSFIHTTNPPRISFGEGGVDDAEDADVIIHEYGHAISFSAAPNTNSGTERKALDEAIGDYLASGYSRAISEYNWQNMFSWDGHNEFWSGRVVDSDKHYPEDVVYNLYSDAEIWSSVLMEIAEETSRETADQILLQSLFSYASNMIMPDAALLFIQADSLLNGGANFDVISKWFCLRGLYVAQCDSEIVCTPQAHFDYVQNDMEVSFQNTSINATDYLWDFGDDSISTLSTPSHVYQLEGTYHVSCKVSNYCGYDMYYDTLFIYNNPNMRLFNSHAFAIGGYAILDLGKRTSGTSSIYNLNGKLLSEKSFNQTDEIEILSPDLSPGVYLVVVKTNNRTQTFKLVRLNMY